METNIKLPVNFYEQLYNEIMGYGFEPENEDDKTCNMEITIGDFTVDLDATFQVNVVDNSFDHAFGTEYIFDLEAGDLEEIEINNIWFSDDDSELEDDVSELFNEKIFWEQFKQYVIKRNGIYIHHGDEVVVKHSWRFGAWEKMVYLYTDTRLGVHVCTRSIHSKCIWKKNFKEILPATTGALAIVGKYEYHLKSRV